MIMGDSLSEYFKDLNSMTNSNCHGNQKKKKIKNLIVPNGKGESFDIWHVASTTDVPPKYFKLWPWTGN